MFSEQAYTIEAVVDEVIVTEEGQVVINVYDNNGEFFRNVKVCGVGGNTTYWSNFPLRKNQIVTLIKTGERNHPVCLGATEIFVSEETLSDLRPIIATTSDVVNDNEDVVSNYTTDWSIVNNGNKLKVTENNGIVINSAQHIRAQLYNEAKLRISKDGSTSDSPLNGQQFIDTLFSYLDALEAKVNANSQFVTSAAPGVAAAYEAAALAADASVPGSGQIFREQSQTATESATQAAIPLATTSATTKSSAEGNINTNILIP